MLPNSERYPARCLPETPNCHENPYNPEDRGGVRGYAVMGSWTHGKTVILDGMFNHTDYGLHRGLQFQREIELYQPSGSFSGWVRVGAGRDSGSLGSGLDNRLESWKENAEVPGMTGTSGVIDSIENKLNAYPNLRPTLPRDVVWLMSNGVGTDEVAFDDWMDPKALIVSSMIASAQLNSFPYQWDEWKSNDGFSRRQDDNPNVPDQPVLLQNAATSPNLPIPPWGYLTVGRVEPVALGGIHGRGLWMDGTNSLVYEFPARVPNSEIFLSLFFENRTTDENLRTLVQFPDGTQIQSNSNGLVFVKGSHSMVLNSSLPLRQWHHLALTISLDGRKFSVYLNGMKKQTFQTPFAFFSLESPTSKITLSLGAPRGASGSSGFRGWIDEFKLFTYHPQDEVICNHAFGSLHWVSPKATKTWKARAAQYPAHVHEEIRQQIPENVRAELKIPTPASFVCSVDYSDYLGIHRSRQRKGEGLISVRESLLFAHPTTEGKMVDGRLLWNQTRINFLENRFCLSCHTSESRRGLSIAALTPGSKCAMNDRRRQPLEPFLFLTGQISDAQRSTISANFSKLPKIRDPRTSALIVDPLVLPTNSTGGSCNSFEPFD